MKLEDFAKGVAHGNSIVYRVWDKDKKDWWKSTSGRDNWPTKGGAKISMSKAKYVRRGSKKLPKNYDIIECKLVPNKIL